MVGTPQPLPLIPMLCAGVAIGSKYNPIIEPITVTNLVTLDHVEVLLS